jgi:multidrug efflux pump subunit AcrA (membrane-fusion protein)
MVEVLDAYTSVPITDPAVTDSESAPTQTPPPAQSTPAPSRGGGFAKWRARFVVVAMVAAAAGGGWKIAEAKVATSADLNIGSVVLTASPLAVQSIESGQITAVFVHAQDRVVAGQTLALLRTSTPAADGSIVHETVRIKAPTAGVVADDPLLTGTFLQSGQSLVSLYDPKALSFLATVPLDDLAHLSPGMTTKLTADGISTPVTAVVDRAVPRIGANQADVAPGWLELVLTPKRPADVANLVPGIRFKATVDTKSVHSSATLQSSLGG